MSHLPDSYQRITINTTDAHTDLLEGLLSLHAPQGWLEADTLSPRRFVVHAEDEGVAANLERILREALPSAQVTRETVPAENWADAWMEYFTPIEAGPFTVVPPWLEEETTAQPGTQAIVIEPKMAFGTGHHGTTRLCLVAIGQLHAAGAIDPTLPFLDLGTGSGILSIGLARMGYTGHALDIDPQSVATTLENRTANRVDEAFTVAEGSIDAATPPYGLVVANILAGPLQEMADDIMAALAPGAPLVLSGLLVSQADDVAAAYAPLAKRYGEPARLVDGEWAALVFTP